MKLARVISSIAKRVASKKSEISAYNKEKDGMHNSIVPSDILSLLIIQKAG